ncbi:MAG: dioxygenase [Myxococcales bacterium]|nr:dioxygenase [Myxococcales bacterium]
MDRRGALRWLAAAATAACSRSAPSSAGGSKSDPSAASGLAAGPNEKMPVVFLAHGAPPLLDDSAWMGELSAWAKRMPRPSSVLMLSAHWDTRPAKLGAVRAVPLVYDFYGFPERYYQTTYPAPGAPALASRVRSLLDGASIAHGDDPERGLDHGAFVPLLGMYPEANVPVLQLSLPGLDPATLASFGRALAPLADEGVLVVGSGFLTHNMRSMGQPTPAWALEFDEWCTETLAKRDVDALVDFRARAPAARLAHPTHEHFAPAIVAAAAASARGRSEVTFPITGFWNGSSFTRRSAQFG